MINENIEDLKQQLRNEQKRIGCKINILKGERDNEIKETTITDVVICPTNNNARGQWVQYICSNKLNYEDALREVIVLFERNNYKVVLGIGLVTDERGTLPGHDNIPYPMNKVLMIEDEGKLFNFL